MTFEVGIKVLITMVVCNVIASVVSVFLFYRGYKRVLELKRLIYECIVCALAMIALYLLIIK